MLFFLESLSMSQKSVHLQCVFHSIRFKVNKGWSTAVLLSAIWQTMTRLPQRLCILLFMNLQDGMLYLYSVLFCAILLLSNALYI